MQTVYIVGAMRTSLGSFGGGLASVPAPRLGAVAIKAALAQAGLEGGQVNEVFMGNVLSANLGQAPARQAAIFADLGHHVPCTTVNKVCASGTKAVMLGAQSIMAGQADVVVAGGMENMSAAPYYLPKARYGYGYGGAEMTDALVRDGLSDAYDQKAMGVCGDRTAEKYGIGRERQDAFAMTSYRRSAESTEKGFFRAEIAAVTVPQRKGDPISVVEDEEYKRVKFDKVPLLWPAFGKGGTVTAANASSINDGAAALVLVGGDKVKEWGLKPLAKIVSFADAAQEPQWFTTAPPLAASKALERAGLAVGDIDFFEVNEAFSVVALSFMEEMGVEEGRVNVFGGAVSLGHPIGCSGARILVTLNNVLRQRKGKLGMAAICNGGGGASALIMERL